MDKVPESCIYGPLELAFGVNLSSNPNPNLNKNHLNGIQLPYCSLLKIMISQEHILQKSKKCNVEFLDIYRCRYIQVKYHLQTQDPHLAI